MDPFVAIVVFVITWCLSFYCVLPIGVHGQFEDDGNFIEGTEECAPKDPMLKKKALCATICAVVLTLIAHFLVVPWLAAS